ncbi:Flp family type IVb pilin [Phycicoccus sp. CSK15P-2]|uniref:Flp family type IVb pilin n=1 Tax=Phycicoccus sp. CSK15P-2 TaxID=2807627 RepID=UPI0019520AA4|nr:Flp family type IVb pilin [Phycicoccus sp. CSK15P-2]MBM6405977.1 Flp family type IVb pilin [Phycicoccus sp. CSK15P-2]
MTSARRTTAHPAEAGATAVEYALMMLTIAIVIIAAITVLGTNVSGIFDEAATSL